MPSDLPLDHPPALVAHIIEVILASPFRTVHYSGAADEGLLRALLADRERLEVSVMDMPDRWGTGYAFWYDKAEFGNCLPRARPDWLEDVPFYQEGAPDHDIALHDWPWSSFDQLARIVAFTGRRPSKLLLLFGHADCNIVGVEGISESGKWERKEILRPAPIHHPAYEWETLGDFHVGR
ncbi:hypothetical protein BH11VER1_BH11VER1_06690 [soil metagenome]